MASLSSLLNPSDDEITQGIQDITNFANQVTVERMDDFDAQILLLSLAQSSAHPSLVDFNPQHNAQPNVYYPLKRNADQIFYGKNIFKKIFKILNLYFPPSLRYLGSPFSFKNQKKIFFLNNYGKNEKNETDVDNFQH